MDFSAQYFAQTVTLVVATMFPIVNPLGTAPIFLGLTEQYDASVRMHLARKIAINSFFLLVASLLVGTHVLSFFGVSIHAVQIGGGMVVLSAGWMLLNREEPKRGAPRADMDADILTHAFYPYTLPLTLGPGSISVAITLGANLTKHVARSTSSLVEGLAGLLIGSVVVCVLIWFFYGFAERLSRAIGATGTSVVMRLSSFILLCIGVQIIANGLEGLMNQINGR